MKKLSIPKEAKNVIAALGKAGFEACVVGGCVRDILLGFEPKDWDIATDAEPEELTKIFPDSFYENKFGTVTVRTASKKANLAEIEVTTYRIEGKYSDKRHPDVVKFTKNLDEDLKRRDFTINAMALTSETRNVKPETHKPGKSFRFPASAKASADRQVSGFTIIDLFGGQEDLKNKLIRAVGEPSDRFSEDALRIMRAVRLATELGFSIEEGTFGAIKDNVGLIDSIAKERVRDELSKIIDSKNAYEGILMLKDSGILEIVLPELAAGINVGQNKHHIYTVFEHNLLALKWAAEHDYLFQVKLAALLHDVGKPDTKQGDGPDSTFYGHEIAGGNITRKVLRRLKFSEKDVSKISMLVRFHLFYYNVGEVTEKSVRRLVARVGPENMDDLIKVRICDRMGSGVPKPEPYRLRHFQYMVDRVQKDPVSAGMLKINGNDIMKILSIEPGPKVGQALAVLLEDVLDDPGRNKKDYLRKKVEELGKLSEKELQTIVDKARNRAKKFDEAVDEKIKEKYWVK